MTSEKPNSLMTDTLSLAWVQRFMCLHSNAWEINFRIITLLVAGAFLWQPKGKLSGDNGIEKSRNVISERELLDLLWFVQQKAGVTIVPG